MGFVGRKGCWRGQGGRPDQATGLPSAGLPFVTSPGLLIGAASLPLPLLQVFKAHYHTILRLKSFFPFSLIDAMGTLEVRAGS